nr:hypothetical protein CFP56_75465 [Quercus suber]
MLDSKNVDGPAKSDNSTEILREVKRKHLPSGMINGAQLGSVLQGLRKVSNYQAQHTLEDGPISVGLENPGNRKEKEGMSPKGFSKASMKGKKDFARATLHKAWSPGADEGSNTQHPPLSVSLFEFMPNERTTMSSADSDQQRKDASKFQFNAKPRSVMVKDGLEVDGVADRSDCMGREIIWAETLGVQEKGVVHSRMAANCNLGNGQQVCHEALTAFPNGHEVVGSSVSYGDGVRNRADEGMVEADRIKFDGGGDASAV